MMNYLWGGMLLLGVIYGAFAGTLDGVTEAIINSAKEAVNLVIAIAGITAFWTGIMKIAEQTGLVEKLARGKCLAVAKEHPGAVVLGCDTVVDVNGEVFGKPHSVEDAKRMLRALSGATHQVHTGVCVSDGAQTKSFVDSCRVTFFPISEEEIERYTATKEPYDKAGAYAIQGRAALWLDRIEGDYYTIMGLPVSRTVQLIEQF